MHCLHSRGITVNSVHRGFTAVTAVFPSSPSPRSSLLFCVSNARLGKRYTQERCSLRSGGDWQLMVLQCVMRSSSACTGGQIDQRHHGAACIHSTSHTGNRRSIFGRPFVKRFALCYRTVVLSLLSVCNVGVL